MIAANSNRTAEARGQAHGQDVVTVVAAGQAFGLPIDRVREVFVAGAPALVPHAPPDVVGLLNLRGKIVLALCLRRRLGLPAAPGGSDAGRVMAVGLDAGGESYCFLVDSVGDVVSLAEETFEPTPVHLDKRWARLARGVHRLPTGLLVVLDVDALLSPDTDDRAA